MVITMETQANSSHELFFKISHFAPGQQVMKDQRLSLLGSTSTKTTKGTSIRIIQTLGHI